MKYLECFLNDFESFRASDDENIFDEDDGEEDIFTSNPEAEQEEQEHVSIDDVDMIADEEPGEPEEEED